MTTIVLILCALAFLTFSVVKSRKRTWESIRIARKMFFTTFTEVIGIMALVGLVLALLPPEQIRRFLGGESELLSTVYGALIGTITIMPAFIAFPLAKSLVSQGAYLITIAAFLTTLTMVGFATFPLEVRHFGRRFALIRNGLSFVLALVIAFGMGVVL